MKRKMMLIMVVLAVGQAASAVAGKVDVGPEQWAVMKNPGNAKDARLLVQFSLPEGVAGKKIEAAYLDWSLKLGSLVEEGVEAEVTVLELARGWRSKEASWSAPWQTPGGDVRAGGPAVWLLRPGVEDLTRFEVTDAVQGWADGSRANHGFLIQVKGALVGLAPGDRAVMSRAQPGPALRIWFTD